MHDLMLEMGVSPGTKRKSCGLYPTADSKTFSKMGHSCRPNGRSSVGAPTWIQSGFDMLRVRWSQVAGVAEEAWKLCRHRETDNGARKKEKMAATA